MQIFLKKVQFRENPLFRAIFRKRAFFGVVSEFFQFSVRFRKKTQFSAQFLKICFVDFRPRAERAGHAVLALNGRGTPAAGAACQELAGERGFAFS